MKGIDIVREKKKRFYDEITIDYKEKYVYQFFKRFFDILFSSLALICFGWFILLMMFIKFCEDGHNPIYTSLRVSKDGKLIKFHKIRSMIVDADKMKQDFIDKGLNEADGPAFKMKNDPRITKFGKILRKTSIDELPQIWDVLVGRLSIVGPRSPIPSEVEKYTPYQKQRFLVKGGLLCLWQIQHNRNEVKFSDWIDYDLKYIEKRSLLLDFKIIVIGFFMVLFDKSGE